MSSLTDAEKRYFEGIFGMDSGYVLDYSDAKFGEFFNRHRIKIHSEKYCVNGTSKARKLRSFWEQEPDALVGRALSEMLDSHEASCELHGKKVDKRILKKTRDIVARLLGETSQARSAETVEKFLDQKFAFSSIRDLPAESAVLPIIESRLDEVRRCMEEEAWLSVVVLCGSILEGVLLGQAQKDPTLFNRSSASPKGTDDKTKKFYDWTLAQFIDVASDVGILKPDVKKFSHDLRDFRNYIHPYQEMASKFTPDEHTARMCFQALKAALASVAGERR